MTPDEVTRTLQALRGCGLVVCDWRPRARHAATGSDLELDAYVDAVGLGALGEGVESPVPGGWREMDLDGARRLLARWLREDLAYGVATHADPQDVASTGDAFFGNFEPAARIFTNTDASSAWTAKTRHTFDQGIVALDARTIGLLWFADED